MRYAFTLIMTLLVGMVVPAVAQTPVTAADLQRLQENVTEISGSISAVGARDPQLAGSLQTRLQDLSDEVTYLKVKLRKESTVSRAEYIDLLDRLDRLRSDARNPPPPAVPERRVSATEIPVGTQFDVRLQSHLNSGTARVEDRFDATTLAPLKRTAGSSCRPAR